MLTEYLTEKMQDIKGEAEEQLEGYFTARMSFFSEHPIYQRIFCEAVIAPPAHLRAEIQERKRTFDALNAQILEQLLEPLPLRPQITKSEIIETFRQFQDFINANYQVSELTMREFEAHEQGCRRALNILLYGVINREEKR